MQAVQQQIGLGSLKSIIDLKPLIVEPETYVLDAIALMAKHSKSTIIGSNSQILGYLTEKDVVKLVASGIDLKTTQISQVMQPLTITLKLAEVNDLTTVLSQLHQLQLSLLPVIDEQGQLIGTITREKIDQVLQQQLDNSNLATKISQLETQQQRQCDRKFPIQALRDSEERFRNLVETSSDLIWEVDKNGIYTYVSPKVKDILGYQPEAVLGKSPLDFMPLDRRESIAQDFAVIFITPQPFQCLENIQVHQNGHLVWLETSGVPIFDSENIFQGYRGISRDVTQRQQAETSLRNTQQQLQAILDNSPAVIYVINSDNRFLLINSKYEHLFNTTQEQIFGKSIYDVWNQDIAHQFAVHNHQVITKGIPLEVEEIVPQADGLHTYLSVKFPLKDANGATYAVCGISTDITERKLVEESLLCIHNDITQRKQAETSLLVSQQRLQYLLSSSPAVIYTCKLSGDFGATFVSENIRSMMGYEARELIEDSSFWASHIHPDDVCDVFVELAQAVDPGCYTLNYRFLHQDGHYRWVCDTGRLVQDEAGNLVEFVGSWTDITKHKQLEQELIIALEKEKELNELKSRFISMTSHEFRTPLSTILSSAELLEHYQHKWTQDKQLTHLRRIQTAVTRMSEMLNDVLFIGKSEAGILDYKPTSFDLVEYCCNLVAEVELDLNNQRLICFNSQSEVIPCFMDEKLLGHILTNLLSNALKYSPSDSNVEFTLYCEDGHAIFEIQDQGIGIPTEDLPHLFESFHRAGNVGNILGTGLGLAIVKKCVEIHQGKISLATTLGVGSKFTVILPLNY